MILRNIGIRLLRSISQDQKRPSSQDKVESEVKSDLNIYNHVFDCCLLRWESLKPDVKNSSVQSLAVCFRDRSFNLVPLVLLPIIQQRRVQDEQLAVA